MLKEQAARGLGWASIGIGLTELAAPRQLERIMGIGNGQNTAVLRTMGVREVMHGVSILSGKDPAPGVWSRVAGDVVDGALLAGAAMKTRRPGGLAFIAVMVLGIAALDLLLASQFQEDRRKRSRFARWPLFSR